MVAQPTLRTEIVVAQLTLETEIDEWLEANDTNAADDATADFHGDLDAWLAANESTEGDKRRTQQCRRPLNPAKNAITREVPKVARNRKKPAKHGSTRVAKKNAVAKLHSTPVKKFAVEVDTPVKYDSRKKIACRCRGAAKREAKRLGLSDDAAKTMWTAAYREGAKMFDDYIAAGGIPVPV